MRSNDTLRRVKEGKYGHSWEAACCETLYALFVCPHCGSVNVKQTKALLSCRNGDKETALKELDQFRETWINRMKTPGPKDGRLFTEATFFRDCKCSDCGRVPPWVAASFWARLFPLLLLIPIIVTWLFVITIFDLDRPGEPSLFEGIVRIFIICFLLFAGVFGVCGLVESIVTGSVKKRNESYPPLFAESIDELKQQTLQCEPYMHSLVTDIRWPEEPDALFQKEPQETRQPSG